VNDQFLDPSRYRQQRKVDLCKLFNNLLGDYASGTTTASIMLSKGRASRMISPGLRGKRFIIVPETEENERLNSSLVKALSAGDQMTARFLFGEFFDFYFTGKLWIATNHATGHRSLERILGTAEGRPVFAGHTA
jgi:putative DNA primase/helicase